MSQDLKDYRKKELPVFVAVNITIMLGLVGLLEKFSVFLEGDIYKILKTLLEDGAYSVMLFLCVFLFDSIFPSKLKDNILWPSCLTCLFGTKPGYVVFTEIAEKNKDDRFTSDDAKKYYADIYKKIESETDKKKNRNLQNSEWYDIYKKYKDDDMIWNSNRDWLLCRDLCISTIYMMLFYTAFGFIAKKVFSIDILNWILPIILFIEFIVTSIAAKNKAKRFVYNVIAQDISERKQEAGNGL